MDPLSQLLRSIYLRQVRYILQDVPSGWSEYYPAGPGIYFYVVLEGQLLVGDTEQVRHLSAMEMIMLTGRLAHRVAVFVPGGCRWIALHCEYDQTLAQPLIQALPSRLPEQHQAGFAHQALTQIGVHYFLLESQGNRLGRDTMMDRLGGMLLVECLRTYIENLDDQDQSWLLALRDPRLAPVLTVLHAQPAQPWTVAQLAKIAGQSRSQFALRFHNVMGQTPLAYLTAHRMRLAAYLLSEQRMPLARVAEQVGYSSDSTLSEAFRRYFGMPPRTWQQTNQLKKH